MTNHTEKTAVIAANGDDAGSTAICGEVRFRHRHIRREAPARPARIGDAGSGEYTIQLTPKGRLAALLLANGGSI